MKFSLINSLSLASSLLTVINAQASPDTVPIRLVAKSDDSNVDNAAISSIHEGAAINYLVLAQGSPGAPLGYVPSLNAISNQLTADYIQYLNIVGGIVQFYPGIGGDVFGFDSAGTLTVNGSSENFWTCQNINDPYKYKEVYFVLYSEGQPTTGDKCASVTLVKAAEGVSNSTTTTAPPPVTTVSTSVTGAVTQEVTVTDCPATVTNCPEHSQPPPTQEAVTTAVEQTNGAAVLTIPVFVLLTSLSAFYFSF